MFSPPISSISCILLICSVVLKEKRSYPSLRRKLQRVPFAAILFSLLWNENFRELPFILVLPSHLTVSSCFLFLLHWKRVVFTILLFIFYRLYFLSWVLGCLFEDLILFGSILAIFVVQTRVFELRLKLWAASNGGLEVSCS